MARLLQRFAWVLCLGLLGLLVGCVTVQQKEAAEMVPMYGLPDIPRDPYLVSEDEIFKKRALKEFAGDARAASQKYSKKAQDFLRYGQIQSAMENFNLAWLLDKNSAQAYWGFGQVFVLQGKLGEAIGYLEKAKTLGVVTFQRPALLVDTGIAYSIQAEASAKRGGVKSQQLFAAANLNFEQSSQLDTSYGEVWRRWSFSLLREQRYEDAWQAVKQARLLGAKKFPPSFLKTLTEALPEPLFNSGKP